MRAFQLCLCCVVVVGCQSAAPPQVFNQTSLDAPLVHVSSAFEFPLQVGDFRRQRPMQYDPAGEDISLSYASRAPVVATIYVYPTQGRSIAELFATRQKEIAQTQPGAHLLTTQNVLVTPKQVSVASASFSFDAGSGGRLELLRSELLIGQCGDRFVEYRFSYPAALEERALAEIARFSRLFEWPGTCLPVTSAPVVRSAPSA